MSACAAAVPRPRCGPDPQSDRRCTTLSIPTEPSARQTIRQAGSDCRSSTAPAAVVAASRRSRAMPPTAPARHRSPRRRPAGSASGRFGSLRDRRSATLGRLSLVGESLDLAQERVVLRIAGPVGAAAPVARVGRRWRRRVPSAVGGPSGSSVIGHLRTERYASPRRRRHLARPSSAVTGRPPIRGHGRRRRSQAVDPRRPGRKTSPIGPTARRHRTSGPGSAGSSTSAHRGETVGRHPDGAVGVERQVVAVLEPFGSVTAEDRPARSVDTGRRDPGPLPRTSPQADRRPGATTIRPHDG